jgi:ferredoxin
MRINPDKCVACGNCTYVCPMDAIYIDPVIRRATINRDECVECYSCFNGLSQEHLNPTMVRTVRNVFKMMRLRFDPEPDVCPTAAFEPDELAWPRVVRRAFSDPRVPHESTGVEGRGTEEVKTNDVSNRVKSGSPSSLAAPASVHVSMKFRRCAGPWRRPASLSKRRTLSPR